MLTNYMIAQALGSVGLFASRAFVPAFAAALLMRFGPQLGLDSGLLAFTGITVAPSWFTSDLCLLILGVLAVAEVAATKHPDLRQALGTIDQYAKPAIAALALMGILDATDAGFLEQNLDPHPPGQVVTGTPEPHVQRTWASSGGSGGASGGSGGSGGQVAAAGFALSSLLVVFVAFGTFMIAGVRSVLVGALTDADEDDDIGIQKLLSWGEDLYAFFGLWFLVLFPVAMLALIVIVSGLLFAARWYLLRREERSKVACGECGELMYRSALACGACATPNENVHRLNLLGAADADRPADRATQPHRLAAARRCPNCATRLEHRRARQRCPRCGHELFADPAFVRAYVDRVTARMPIVLCVTACLGLVWIIGVVPGVIYYRMAVVAPFRRYIPAGRRVAAKFGIAVLFFILLTAQALPLVGLIALPLMAFISFLAYRALFLAQLDPRNPPGNPPGTSPGSSKTSDPHVH